MKSIEEKFWSGVEKRGHDECWPWKKSLTVHGGYGQFTHGKGNLKKAHRVAYELHYGAIPKDLYVCHKCNNPQCCNPKHLYAGTPQDNWDDTKRCGHAYKFPIYRGTQCHSAKLTEEDAVKIFNSNDSLAVLAKKYGVSKSAVSLIKRGKSWKWATIRFIHPNTTPPMV